MSGTTGETVPPAETAEETSTGGGGNTPNNQQQGAPGNATPRTPSASNLKNQQNTKAFKGATAKMNSHVFQLHAKRNNKSQFSDTMEALKIYASTAFKNDIEALTLLFTGLKEPMVPEPEDPEEEMTVAEDGTVTRTVSVFP